MHHQLVPNKEADIFWLRNFPIMVLAFLSVHLTDDKRSAGHRKHVFIRMHLPNSTNGCLWPDLRPGIYEVSFNFGRSLRFPHPPSPSPPWPSVMMLVEHWEPLSSPLYAVVCMFVTFAASLRTHPREIPQALRNNSISSLSIFQSISGGQPDSQNYCQFLCFWSQIVN